jgi:RND family efflux transporter MFP subunit
MINSLFKSISNHKFAFGFLVILLVGGGYYVNKTYNNTAGETKYVLTAAKKETLITSVTGSGQVSVFHQIDIKPKASGELVKVLGVNGQSVKAGAALAYIDATDADRTVRDAKINLDSANLALQKLKQPADALTILQAENSLSQAKVALQTAQDNLKSSYDDGFNNVSNAFLDLPNIMSGLNDIVLGYAYNQGQANSDYYYDKTVGYDDTANKYRDDVNAKYAAARAAYDKNFADYKAASRSSDTDTIDTLINETYDTAKSISEAVKSSNNQIQFFEDQLTKRLLKTPVIADTQLTSLNNYTAKTNTHLSNLFSTKQTIQTSRDTIVNANMSIAEKTKSLAELRTGADPLDIRAQNITIQQRQYALSDAQSNLANYVVTAPFDGVIASMNFKKSDIVSTGDSVATLITKQRTANISLNEIDAAKIAVGQKATLTFDAVDGLSITGEVSLVDMIGTVSQGVVTYNIQIIFDTQDDRIKPGMSVSAAIITDVKQDVLTVPSGAVKTQGSINYIETLDGVTTATDSKGIASTTPPIQKQVEIGTTSDTSTEITSGLNEGDLVITKTIAPTTGGTAAATTAPSLFGTSGRGGIGGAVGGGGGFRAGGG